MFGRRDAVLVFIAVFIAENSQINVTALHLFEINLIRTAVFGWKFLKKKNFGNETVQEGIAEKKGLQVQANLFKFLLDTADEYFQTYRLHAAPFAIPSIILLNSLSTFASKSASIW